jgi:hypothetical protein
LRVYSYVVRWDHGFAPNPFYSICTLATCKPDIRTAACVGDVIFGTGSATRKLAGHAVFVMWVEKIISFDDYWRDPQYARKIPVMNGSLQQRFGDNIYHRSNGKWLQADSRHSQIGNRTNARNLKRDTGKTDRILIGSEFVYWGGSGPLVPAALSRFVHATPGHRAFFSAAEISRFCGWIGRHKEKGMVGEPCEWRYERYWR